MPEYKPTIGLEIHAELKTRTKMFCDSKNDPDEKRPNVNVCPICLAHPGTLPTINKEAVKHVLKVGLALGGKLADFSEFDRKNYFYPDIPKSYQISQYKYPLVTGGTLLGVAITRVHLEEDTARSIHDQGDFSLIDFNRAGIPLMELVTEPRLGGAKEAGDFARELQLLLRYLGVSDADMEKGHMRVEANVSVSKAREKGVKVEVKNLNSFRSAERAIDYEIKRQIEVLESGGKVVQETRGWDDASQETFSQRSKEYAHDYRYFPEPDLPKMKIFEVPEFAPEKLRAEMPESPWQKRERYKKEFGIKDADIEIFVDEPKFAQVFEEIAKILADKKLIQLASNYLTSDFVGLRSQRSDLGILKGRTLFPDPKNFAELIKMAGAGKISSRGAKDLLEVLLKEGGNVRDLAEKHGLLQKSDEAELKKIIEKVISVNPKAVSEYKSGKTASLQFLIGAAMRESRGSANPGVLRKLFEEMLK